MTYNVFGGTLNLTQSSITLLYLLDSSESDSGHILYAESAGHLWFLQRIRIARSAERCTS